MVLRTPISSYTIHILRTLLYSVTKYSNWICSQQVYRNRTMREPLALVRGLTSVCRKLVRSLCWLTSVRMFFFCKSVNACKYTDMRKTWACMIKRNTMCTQAQICILLYCYTVPQNYSKNSIGKYSQKVLHIKQQF